MLAPWRLGALALIVSWSPASAQTARVHPPGAGLDAYVAKALTDWEAPGLAIAVVRNDSVIFAQGFGVREIGKPDRVTPNTVFAIGSTSKAFTAGLLGMLVDEKRIAWDDPVTKYLPGFELYDSYATRDLTIRDLLTHRSGLSRGDRVWSNSGHSRAEVLRRVRFLQPSWPFRSRYGYQNIMFLAAGTVAESVASKSWDDLMAERIFRPLGMSRSVTSVTALPAMTDVATPHEKLGGKTTAVDWQNIDNMGPAGSINSSVTDMAQWIRLQLGQGTYQGNKLLEPNTVKEMHTAQMHQQLSGEDEKNFPETHLLSYGLGWAIRDYRGMKVVSHGGAIRGMRAQVVLVPERKLGVVVLTNVAESSLPTAMGYKMVDLYTAGPAKDWSALLLASAKAARGKAADERRKAEAARVMGTQPTLELSRYPGVYADSMYGDLKIASEGDRLVATFGPQYTGDLAHWNYDTFEVTWRNPVFGKTLITFQLDANGRTKSLEYPDVATFGRRN